MILVTVGTHNAPFDRLVEAAEAYARQTGERVVVQRGPSAVATPSCESYAWLSPADLEALADGARALVTHGGPGSIFLAWERALPVIVVPREAARGEHVDDHQVRFAEHLGDRILLLRDASRLSEALQSVAFDGERASTGMRQNSQDFAQRLESIVQALVADRHRGDRAR